MLQQIYRNQLQAVLRQFKPKMDDVMELYANRMAIEAKSKDNKYKQINLEEIDKRIKELTN